ncbi:MAG: hypothetical protein ACRCX2_01635 [Paraclostridium sp.]
MEKYFEIFSLIFTGLSLFWIFYSVHLVKKGMEYEKIKLYNHISVMGLNTIGLISFILAEQYYMISLNLVNFWFYFFVEVNYYKSRISLNDMQIKILLDYGHEMEKIVDEYVEREKNYREEKRKKLSEE